MKSASWGVAAFLGVSVTWMAAAAWYWGRSEARPAPARPATGTFTAEREATGNGQAVAPTSGASAPNAPAAERARRAQRLVARLAHLIEREGGDDELAALERELLDLGEVAGEPLVALLRNERDEERHNRLLDFLRKVPGAAAEDYFIEQAGGARENTTRTLAMDELASRRTEASLAALNRVATTDPELPREPFLAAPRQPGDDSTELPDAVFTPRMKALGALASTEDPRVVPMLTEVMLHERDESLRMEAATQLQRLRTEPAAVDALLQALRDRSAYVRLAALHSLSGCEDPRLFAVLTELSQRDSDLGVRALARQLLARAQPWR
jgi:hypothetical protein